MMPALRGGETRVYGKMLGREPDSCRRSLEGAHALLGELGYALELEPTLGRTGLPDGQCGSGR
jgi:hypothetical protein